MAAGMAAAAVAATATAGVSAAHADEIAWDYAADVVVTGTGGAGITTAMVAADAGSRVSPL